MNIENYLKNLKEEDYKIPEIRDYVLENLKETTNCEKYITDEVFSKLITSDKTDKIEDYIMHLPHEVCIHLKDALKTYLEKGLEKNGKDWFAKILYKNTPLYHVLDKEKHKTDEMKTLLLPIFRKDHYLFWALPEEWKQDTKYILEILSEEGLAKGRSEIGNRNFAKVLNEIKDIDKFLAEANKDLPNLNPDTIRARYYELNEKWRGKEEIILMIFKQRDAIAIINKQTCKNIPIEELSDELTSYLSQFSEFQLLSSVGESLTKIVNHHFMKKSFNEKTEMVKPKIRTPKI